MNENKAKESRSLIKRFQTSGLVELSGIICLIVTYAIFVQFQNGVFLSTANIINILRQIVVYGILSCALAFPMINGTFDLSIGATCALGGTLCALLTTSGLYGLKLPFVWAVLLSVALCAIIGAVNGLIVSLTEIPPFIVTLGLDTTVRGIVYIVCNNSPVGYLPKEFLYFGATDIFGIPISVIIMFVIFIIVGFVLRKTTFGRKIYANGGNYQAAYQSGINVKGVRFTVYVISAALAAIAGILMTARVGSATPNAANGYATIAISACAMGGVSLAGGSGRISGVFLGAVMMGMITNGMNLMYIGSNWQLVIRGILMIIAVLYSLWVSKVAARNK